MKDVKHPEWEAICQTGTKAVHFYIGGATEPDGALIAHAQEIVKSFGTFEEKIARFLEAEAQRAEWIQALADEIRQLVIEGISLPWPEKPREGTIWFQGPDKYRVWRCDYVNGEPTALGFDD